MKKYFALWLRLLGYTATSALESRVGIIIFILGKFVRFFVFILLLVVVTAKVHDVSHFSREQILLFFLTFNFVDVTAQVLLREVYRFKSYVVNGQLDFFLLKPFSVLFRGLFGGGDLLDVPLALFTFGWIVTLLITLHLDLLHVIFYLFLIINSFILSLSIHIIILGFTVRNTEVDDATTVYREIFSLGRFPVDIYQEPLRSIVTFIVPVGIMMTFPVKALFGLLSWQLALVALGFTLVFLLGSISFWQKSLGNYLTVGD